MIGFRTAVAACLLLSAACVEVPDSVRAHFADPRADERNNYRKTSPRGTAPPNEEPEPALATAAASAPQATVTAVTATADGGAP